jgi:hypothetical protein
MDSDIDLEINFRFLALSEKQAASLKKNIIESEFGKHFKTKNITGLVPLSVANISLIYAFIEENKISVGDTDIFISFVTEYDTHIIDTRVRK